MIEIVGAIFGWSILLIIYLGVGFFLAEHIVLWGWHEFFYYGQIVAWPVMTPLAMVCWLTEGPK